MKILDRYMISEFLKPLGVGAAIFTILVLVGHFFDKMSIFNDFHAHLLDIINYLFLGLPYWLNVIFPVVTLLALMFSLGPLRQRGEITAIRSAGVSSARLYAPFLVMGVLISIVSLISGLSLIPFFTSRANVIYWERIKQQQVYSTLRDHIVVSGRDNQHFTIGSLDITTGIISDIVIDRFDDSERHLSTLSAQQAHYQNGGVWTFTQGNLIQFGANNTFQQEAFKEKVLDIHEKPADFVYENRKPDDMTHNELIRRIHHLHELGIPSFKEQVALHLQFALPFANIMVILLGIPFALAGGARGGSSVQNVAYAFGATFLYWGMVSIFQSYGEQGYIPSWIAAWAANFFFGILAILLLQRVTRI